MTQGKYEAGFRRSIYVKWRFLICIICIYLGGCNRQLQPFASDGCSTFPDGTLANNELWLSCCEKHDLAYWQGGSFSEKLYADESLQRCVANIGKPEVAKLMLAGVALGGSAYLPTAFRWGYGWPYPRIYKALSAEEEKQIGIMLGKVSPIVD
jgi:hypothetical protein